jgi:CDP-4-dehydro-6-deoxyglucose reductase
LWFPTINSDECDGCKGTFKCVHFCPYEVLTIIKYKVTVVNPLHCIHGCTTCAILCPKNAIIFPPKQKPTEKTEKKSSLHKVVCKSCGKGFITDRETEHCFDCEKLDIS